MVARRIESKASKTADFTCACRALSWLETRPLFKSEDWVAPRLLPRMIQWMVKLSAIRKLLSRIFGPRGIYPWVIARTKYIDDWFVGISQEGFKQVLIFGAGFDSRSVRFAEELTGMRVFELDAGTTQMVKTAQFRKRQVQVPENVTFIPINFEMEAIAPKLEKAGYCKDAKTLLVMEGVLQYLRPTAVQQILAALQDLTGTDSRLICDFAHDSFFLQDKTTYGKSGLQHSLERFGETFQFGLTDAEVEPFFAGYGFKLVEYIKPEDLEEMYFREKDGVIRARINGTQCIITAERL